MAHKPTDVSRGQVEAMAGFGIPQEDIARVLNIAPQTLRSHYRDELDTGSTKANAKVAENLFRKATGDGQGAVAAAIFWAKTRMGWRETPRIEHEGLDKALDGLSREELKALASNLTVASEEAAGDGSREAGGKPAGGLSTVH